MLDGLVVDLFAGGGGASQGIEAALGRPVDIAINHDAIALAVHKANHPKTQHVEEDIWKADPAGLVKGRPVALLWASPDCTHFSTAKGGKPRKKKLRTLAWAVYRWAKATRPAVIFLENVKEFEGWGPLRKDGKPDKRFIGKTFRCWVHRIERLGYVVEHRMLDASLYGAPTRRRRLFIVARRDGKPIVWPTFTHGPGGLPLRTAAECIDWSLPCPSIFERRKALADKTQWRIAKGIERFVINNPRPFIVRYNNDGTFRGQGLDAPLSTVDTQNRFGLVTPHIVGVGGRAGQSDPTAGDAPIGTITAKNDRALVAAHITKFQENSVGQNVEQPLDTVMAGAPRFGIVAPHLIKVRGDSHGAAVDVPMPTITAGPKENPAGAAHALGLIAPHLIKVNHGDDEKTGQREHSLGKPLTAVTAQGNGHALVAPHLVQVNHGGEHARGEAIDAPLTTVTAQRRGHGLVASTLVQTGYGEKEGQAPRVPGLGKPLGTVVSGQKHGLVSAFLSKHYTGVVGHQLELGVGAITAKDHHALTAAHLVKLRGQCHGAGVDEPLPTLSAQGTHVAEVRAFLIKYYGTGRSGTQLSLPMHTLTAKDRMALVVVEGIAYEIADIGMRMLEPHELLRAQFGRFAERFDLSQAIGKSGKWCKSEAVRLIGNSVCPEVAERLVAVNLPDSSMRVAA